MKRRITVRAIIYKNGQLLAVQHKANDGNGKNFWCTPGGGLEDGESLMDGVAREVKEELGIDAQVGSLLFVQQYRQTPDDTYDYDEFLEFFFLIENSDDFAAIDLHATSHGDAEISQVEFIDLKTVTFLPKFITEIDLEAYTASSLPPYIHTELE